MQLIKQEPMSLEGFCKYLNSAMSGYTDAVVDISNFEPSVWTQEEDFTRQIRIVFTDRKSKMTYGLNVSSEVAGRATEGQIRGQVMRAYRTAVDHHEGSKMMEPKDVPRFLQSVVLEAATFLFALQ